MRKLVLTCIAIAATCGAPAFAADMAVKASPPPTLATPTYSWTGFYVGGNAGYGWTDPTVSFTANDPTAPTLATTGTTAFNMSGALGGVQAGYNWQFNRNWLLGIETDFDWTGIKGTGNSNFSTASFGFPANFQATQKDEWFGTIRGRLGFLPTNNLLIYGTAGFAYGRVDQNANLTVGHLIAISGSGFGFSCTAGVPCFTGASSRTATGWSAGGGLEYALWNNISVRAEYLYVNLGGGNAFNVVALNSAAPGNAPSSYAANFSGTTFQVVRGGLNYKF